MRAVNLSRRPFVNRRLILRVTTLLWVLGAVLLIWNVRLYTDYWLGTAENRMHLEDVESRLEEQGLILDRRANELGRVDLGDQNRQAAFLNSLISFRTFPWSALFEDLEDVLPRQVKLFNVSPAVRLAEDLARERRLAERRAAAQERRRAQAARSRSRPTTETAEASAETSRPEAAEDATEADEVGLRLNGFAESEDALIELVDRLFENPQFRRPVLNSESTDRTQGPQATTFTLNVVYLTQRDLPEAGVVEAVAEEDVEDAESTDLAATSEDTAEGELALAEAGGSGSAPPTAGEPPSSVAGRGPSASGLAPPLSRPGEAQASSGAERPRRGLSRPGLSSGGSRSEGRRSTSRPDGRRARSRSAQTPGTPVFGVPGGTAGRGGTTGGGTAGRGTEPSGRTSSPRQAEPQTPNPNDGEDGRPAFGDQDASATPGIRSVGGGQARLDSADEEDSSLEEARA